MAFLILIAFIAVPIIEIAVFIEVGGQIGLWSTIGVVIMTAVIGTALLRQQGLSVLFRIQENIEAKRVPIQELFDGLCLVIAGALLLTPGFVTDAIGFSLFVPPFRRYLAAIVAARVISRADVHYHTSSGARPYHSEGGDIIDGDFEDVTPDAQSNKTPPDDRS